MKRNIFTIMSLDSFNDFLMLRDYTEAGSHWHKFPNILGTCLLTYRWEIWYRYFKERKKDEKTKRKQKKIFENGKPLIKSLTLGVRETVSVFVPGSCSHFQAGRYKKKKKKSEACWCSE